MDRLKLVKSRQFLLCHLYISVFCFSFCETSGRQNLNLMGNEHVIASSDNIAWQSTNEQHQQVKQVKLEFEEYLSIRQWYRTLKKCSHHVIVPNNCIRLVTQNITECAQCQFEEDSFNTTICYVDFPVNVTGTLDHLDRKNTVSLKLVLRNYWSGDYQFKNVVDLTLLKDMQKLQRLQIVVCMLEYSLRYNISFQANTFDNLKSLRKLRFNVPLAFMDASHIMKQLTNLRILDLSYTRAIGMEDMIEIIRSLNPNMEELVLNNFQMIGNSNYNSTLDFDRFLTNRFLKLKGINVRDNSLVNVLPGLYNKAPNLKVLDISRNIILDGSNVAFIFEALLHPSLVCLYMTDQGVVGGGPEAYFHTKFTAAECGDVVSEVPTGLEQHSPENKNQLVTRKTGPKSSGISDRHEEESDTHRQRQLESNYHEDHEYRPFLVSNPSHFYVQYNYAYSHFINCVNTVVTPRFNISGLFYQKNVTLAKLILFQVLQCLLPTDFKYGPPIEVIPPLSEIFCNSCMLKIKLPLGKSLKSVYFERQHWEKTLALGPILHGNLCFAPNVLKTLVFAQNSPWVKPLKIDDDFRHTYSISGLDTVETLDISFNNIPLNIAQKMASLTNIRKLYLSGNNVSLPSNFQFCLYQEYLLELHLDDCHLGINGGFPQTMVSGCSHLQVLNLGRNYLDSFALENLFINATPQISILNLTENILTTLKKNFLKQLSELDDLEVRKGMTLHLDLSKNNIICNCGEYAFLQWLVEGFANSDISVSEANDAVCLYYNNSFIKLSNVRNLPFKTDCSKFWQNVEWVSGTFGTTLLILVVFLLYKLRWRLRYKLFKLKQICANFTLPPNVDKTKYMFDAYVAYADDDRFWVCHTLLSKIEREFSFRLCIRDRDFKPGYDKWHLTAQGIRNSRDMIIVCSDMSLNYECFSFELDEAILHKNQTGRSLIVVSLKTIGVLEEHPVAAHILDTNSILEWLDNDHAKKLFWERMIGKLYGQEFDCSGFSQTRWLCFGNEETEDSDESTRLLPMTSDIDEYFCNTSLTDGRKYN